MTGTPLISVVIPTLGDETRVSRLLDALERQTTDPGNVEVSLVFDGTPVAEAVRSRASSNPSPVRLVVLPRRAGPGAARNAGAAAARGDFLAFTEDDVTPAPDWLERAAARLRADPELDVLEGLTVKPGRRRVHRQAGRHPLYLPTNLFVRRALFEKLGGYDSGFFDAGGGVYFREDSDFGFRLEKWGARIERDDSILVEHPVEHPRFLDPLRWARRYEMDARLEARHPDLFRQRIEVLRLGPFTIRRPIVRASAAYVLTLALALAASLAGITGVAVGLLGMAAVTFLVVWAKWRFDPLRLPVYLVVPFVLVVSYLRGRARVAAGPDQDGGRGTPRA